jgi:hypothetical protein
MMIDLPCSERKDSLPPLQQSTGMSAAFPSNPDDDNGGHAWRISSGIWIGTGAELRKPLGITIIGGLMVSQLLTLYTTPCVYLAFSKLSQKPRVFRIGNVIDERALTEAK